jgi:hypothetical protein
MGNISRFNLHPNAYDKIFQSARDPKILQSSTTLKINTLATKTFVKATEHLRSLESRCVVIQFCQSYIINPIFKSISKVIRIAIQIFYNFPITSFELLQKCENKLTKKAENLLNELSERTNIPLDTKDLAFGICYGMSLSFVRLLKELSSSKTLNENGLKSATAIFASGGHELEAVLQSMQDYLGNISDYNQFLDKSLGLEMEFNKLLPPSDLDKLPKGIYNADITGFRNDCDGFLIKSFAHRIALVVLDDNHRFIFDPNYGLMRATTKDAFEKICVYYQEHKVYNPLNHDTWIEIQGFKTS